EPLPEPLDTLLEQGSDARVLSDQNDIESALTASLELSADERSVFDNIEARSENVINELSMINETIETKFDLARAYIDMSDKEEAQRILQEIVADGDEQQRAMAASLLTATKVASL
ncbi:MAG: pilus assembly protein FimV, partial [Halothiobacillaceae bacterium]